MIDDSLTANSLLKMVCTGVLSLQRAFLDKTFYFKLYIYIMNRVKVLLIVSLIVGKRLMGQGTDSSHLIMLNQAIDNYVVQRNVQALDTLYANDFVFSHGSGKIEGKSGWLMTVEKGNYPMRQHDSVTVEMHPGLAIVKGKMSIHRIDKDKTARYHLRYIRVYALRNKRWQMISHNTTHERHE
jgi:Domain of unknown function (DUF4440)